MSQKVHAKKGLHSALGRQNRYGERPRLPLSAEKGPTIETLVFDPHVRDALNRHLPVVALETTILSHGMPFPQNLETALAVELQHTRRRPSRHSYLRRQGRQQTQGDRNRHRQHADARLTPCR